MLGAACIVPPLARPISGIAARLPQVLRSEPTPSADPRLPLVLHSNSSLIDRHSSLHFLIAGDKLLETDLTPAVPIPNAFLIAGVCPTFFSPAPLPAILIGTPIRLKADLTHSQQTRKHFLIGTIRPTLTPAPLSTHHSSLITRHRISNRYSKLLEIELTPSAPAQNTFLIATICPTFTRAPLRYKMVLSSIGDPAGALRLCFRAHRTTNHSSPLTIHPSLRLHPLSALTHPQPSCYSESPDAPRHQIAIPKKLRHARQILRRNAHGDPS